MLSINKPGTLFYLILIFALVLLPFAATLVQHYPDEWHYINSVLIMQHTGDYLTPRNDVPDNISGLLRLNKPIVTYWSIAAAFKIFGIHVFSLRVFFLLAGIATLWLTAAIAQRVFNHSTTTCLAVVILMTQVQFIFASMRAIPDILLVFFLTLSAFGVVRLLCSPLDSTDRDRILSWWCFYLGAAFAVETKGLLALLFVAYCLLFLAIFQRDIFKRNLACQIYAAAAALIIAGSWYLVMWVKYRNLFIHTFMFDQVTWRIHHSVWLPLRNIPYAFLILIIGLLPWGILAMLVAFQRRGLRRMPVYWLILGWSGLLATVVGFGSNISPRYLLPLAPLLSVLCAGLIWQAPWHERIGRYFLRVSLILLILGLLFFSLIVAQLISIKEALIILIVTLGLALFIYSWARDNRKLNPWVGGGVLLFLLFGSSFIPLSSIVMPNPAQQIVGSLNLMNGKAQQLDYIGPNRLASNIRLLSVEKIIPNYLGASIKRLSRPPSFPLLISSRAADQLNLTALPHCKITVSKNLEKLSLKDFIQGVFTWNLSSVINAHQLEYWLIL